MTLVELGKVAGIAGIALGIFLILYRDVLRKKIFAKLPAAESYRLLRLIIILVWTIAVLGIAAWLQGSRETSLKQQAAANWKKSSEILEELAIGRNRNYIITVAGIPPDSIDASVGKEAFRVDRYGAHCCGELILFYQKDMLVGFAAKHFAAPNFGFTLYYQPVANFTLGKSTYRDIGEKPLEYKDDFVGGPMSMCYVEHHYYGKPGAYNDYFYSTTLSADYFKPEKYKNRRDMPVGSIVVASGDLFCTAGSDNEEKSATDPPTCIDPWMVACTYFDNMSAQWSH